MKNKKERTKISGNRKIQTSALTPAPDKVPKEEKDKISKDESRKRGAKGLD